MTQTVIRHTNIQIKPVGFYKNTTPAKTYKSVDEFIYKVSGKYNLVDHSQYIARV